MRFLTREEEAVGYAPGAFAFWRNQAVYFCAYSLIGHWLEIIYCSFMNIFGIVDADSLVWDDPFYPFLVYGVGTLVCALLLVPLRINLVKKAKTIWGAAVVFYLVTVFVCMVMELTMGLMLNQPNAAGEYPLWDNSELPLNILGQAWLVNDVVLGAVAMLYTWVLYPLNQRLMAMMPLRLANALSAIVVVGFVILCVVKFSVPTT